LEYDLSYVIATRNRLVFLKITLKKLLDELHPGEEVVVVDGNSTDGSKEFLQTLFDEGKINQFISEPDRNQAHAWNKAMLLAKGTVIKKIIDDDVFCYMAIRDCKDFMLQNPGTDVVISNDLGITLDNHTNVQKHSRFQQFEKWKAGLTASFTFGDVHMLIRRSSLAYIGLYNTAYVMMDWEYALRISYLKANIAYYTGFNALSVAHPQNVTALKDEKLVTGQGKRANIFYEYPGDNSEISLWSKSKIFIGKKLYGSKGNIEEIKKLSDEDIGMIYNYCYNYISDLNNSQQFTFVTTN
jgi:glycosyltransferase involved in cell wall biosynthesis